MVQINLSTPTTLWFRLFSSQLMHSKLLSSSFFSGDGSSAISGVLCRSPFAGYYQCASATFAGLSHLLRPDCPTWTVLIVVLSCFPPSRSPEPPSASCPLVTCGLSFRVWCIFLRFSVNIMFEKVIVLNQNDNKCTHGKSTNMTRIHIQWN